MGLEVLDGIRAEGTGGIRVGASDVEDAVGLPGEERADEEITTVVRWGVGGGFLSGRKGVGGGGAGMPWGNILAVATDIYNGFVADAAGIGG